MTFDPAAMRAQVEPQIERVKAKAAAMATIVGTASSEDGFITVTVGPTGALLGVDMDPKAMRMASEDLSAAIVSIAKVAVQDAAAKVRELWGSPAENNGLDVAATATGSIDVAADLDARMAQIRESLGKIRQR